MKPTIAVIAPGEMGAAIGARLCSGAARVLTSLQGRSAASVRRAAAAGLEAVDDAELMQAEVFLSIVPPDQALPLAQRFAALAGAGGRLPLYADLNAIEPQTVQRVEAVITAAGGRFVDGCIIGFPPGVEGDGPTLYLSGAVGELGQLLSTHGLMTRVMDAPSGAASALKMAYSGISKGLIALGASMLLAAERHGVLPCLLDELGQSQPELLQRFQRAVPSMLPKAYRWAPEMREIEAFIGTDWPESGIYAAMARFYERIAGLDADDASFQRLRRAGGERS